MKNMKIIYFVFEIMAHCIKNYTVNLLYVSIFKKLFFKTLFIFLYYLHKKIL